MSRPAPRPLSAYRYTLPITTRWMDNDVFGHVNNVTYYSWIDTAVNRFLIDNKLLDIVASPTVGIVAETSCRYLKQISYPDPVTVGVGVLALGRSSVRYSVGVFRSHEQDASAEAHFVHVYCERATMRPVPIPDFIRAEMEKIVIEGEG